MQDPSPCDLFALVDMAQALICAQNHHIKPSEPMCQPHDRGHSKLSRLRCHDEAIS